MPLISLVASYFSGKCRPISKLVAIANTCVTRKKLLIRAVAGPTTDRANDAQPTQDDEEERGEPSIAAASFVSCGSRQM
jgi:hypothetical protein